MSKRFLIPLAFWLWAGAVVAAEPSWAWVAAMNVVDKWDISKGKATVIIAGETFTAQLYWEDHPNEVKVTLKGTIKNGKVAAVETIWGSDYDGSKYTGSYSSKRWSGFAESAGGEVITLTDGWGMIGLTRAITK
jgi:hypothetical protein